MAEVLRQLDTGSETKFSLSTLVANLLNPIPLTNAVLKVMTQEDILGDLEYENQALNGIIVQLAERIQTLEVHLTLSQENGKVLQGELTARDRNVLRLQVELGHLQKENLTHNTQVLVLDDQLEQSQSSLNRIKNSLDEYIGKFQQAGEESIQLKSQMSELREQVSELRSKESEVNVELTCLKYKLGKLQGTIDKNNQVMSDSVSDIAMEKKELKHELSETHERLQQCESDIEKYECEMQILRDQVELNDEEAKKHLKQYNSYKDTHTHSNREYLQQNDYIIELENGLDQQIRARNSFKKDLGYIPFSPLSPQLKATIQDLHEIVYCRD